MTRRNKIISVVVGAVVLLLGIGVAADAIQDEVRANDLAFSEAKQRDHCAEVYANEKELQRQITQASTTAGFGRFRALQESTLADYNYVLSTKECWRATDYALAQSKQQALLADMSRASR